MTGHEVRSKLPSGFTYANTLQIEEYNRRDGFINGARKICLVMDDQGTPNLALRFGPPHLWEHVVSPLARREPVLAQGGDRDKAALAGYVEEYNRGWTAARRDFCAEWDDGSSSAAFDDGYLDRAAGRAKWHLTYCTDHGTCCGEG